MYYNHIKQIQNSKIKCLVIQVDLITNRTTFKKTFLVIILNEQSKILKFEVSKSNIITNQIVKFLKIKHVKKSKNSWTTDQIDRKVKNSNSVGQIGRFFHFIHNKSDKSKNNKIIKYENLTEN